MLKKILKANKMLSYILSFVICTVMCTGNASAIDLDSTLNPISEQTRETIDISQLIETEDSQNTNNIYNTVSIDTIEDNIDINELPNVDLCISNENIALPYATPNPLSTLGITNIWLGDSDVLSTTTGKWTSVYSSSSPKSSISCSIDSTDYSYIRFRVYQWGYTTSSSNKLDNKTPFSSINVASYNSSGNIASSGDVVYGFLSDYIFSIPSGNKSSTAKFIGYYYQGSSNITKTATVNISWKTPTGPAPTTPSLAYNQNPDYAYVTGVDTTMEYRAKFDNNDGTYSYSTWTSFTSSELLFPIYNDKSYTLQIRYKSSTNGNPSLNCEIPVKIRSDGPNAYVEYDGISEILAIYSSDRQIELALGDGRSYISVSPAYYNISSFIDAIPSGGFNRIYVRYAATATEPASKSLTLKLFARNPDTPTEVYYENGVLYNLTSNMIFRFNSGSWYSTQYSAVNVTAFMSSDETTLLEIRYMPTDTTSCSAIRSITLPSLSK